MQLRGRQIARNVVFNWLGTGISMAVGFFLSPFILHRLGNIAYGVWVLTVSVVGYLNLLDLGMQSSVLRFVSQGYTKQDHEGASEAASAALWVRLQISLLALIASLALAVLFPHLFTIPRELAREAQGAIVLIGLTTAVNLSFGVVGGVLAALNRYDLQNYVSLLQTLLRVLGVVAVLQTGHGIVAIAACEFGSVLIGRLFLVWFARRLYPELRLRVKKPKRETLRKIWSYSSYTFLTTIAIQLVYQTDNIVVGAFVSTAAVTTYAIANSLCRYAGQVVGSMDSTFMPAASTFEAAGATASLLMLYKNGTRAIMVVSLPIILTLIIRGPSFISLWMGPQYAHSSGIVLAILSIGLFFSFANRTAAAIAFGIGKHKTIALWAVAEGFANLALSILLAHWYGIYGVAIGTLGPSLLIQLVFWPRYISKLIGVSSSEVILDVWGPLLLASLPFALLSYAFETYYPAHSLITFALQVLATLPALLLPLVFVFRTFVRSMVLPRIRTLLFAASS